MSSSLIVDILFLVTVILLVFNGLKNGALFSIIGLLVLPIGFAVAYFFGPGVTIWLADANLPATPLIAYALLFIGTILVLHIVGSFLRRVIKVIPLFGSLDTLLGGVIGFVEAWLIWLVLLVILGAFLAQIQDAITTGQNAFSGMNITDAHVLDQFQQWHDFYNEVISNSLFAHVNGFFVKVLPAVKLKPLG
jgi:uncharacterized membrane protein required for colicin V production